MHVAEGDLDDPASIDAAIRDVESIVLVSPAVPAQELNVIDSAARAGVGHVVKITSKASADSPIARQRGQAEIEAGLIASGLDYTLLRNNFYMQNFLMLAPTIATTSSFGSVAGAGQVGLIDTRDVAAVAAEIAAAPAVHVGRTYLLAGPELLSYADVAAALLKVLARPIAFHERTFEEDKQAMIDAGVPAAIAEMNARSATPTAGSCERATSGGRSSVCSALSLPAAASSPASSARRRAWRIRPGAICHAESSPTIARAR